MKAALSVVALVLILMFVLVAALVLLLVVTAVERMLVFEDLVQFG